MRADQLLVAHKLAPTRSAAQRLIDSGAAEWASPTGWARVRKSGEDLPPTAQFRITDDAELRFVSRGGLKLEGALKHCGLSVAGFTALDMGQSTGGFSDCLLKGGSALEGHKPEGGFDLIVGDLSFISMLGALPHLKPWLRAGGQVLLLVKPQFELGPKAVGRGGLVKDSALYPQLQAQAREACAALGWAVRDYFQSPITGGDGNTEFFLWAQAPEQSTP